MGQNNGKNDLKELSEKLRYYREASALSHQQVANALGIDRSTYTKYETGDSRPRLPTLLREGCPNFIPGEDFYSAASFVPTARVLSELPKKDKAELLTSYIDKIYKGCGKSLSCRDICPAQIDVEHLLVNNNAVAVWKRFIK